MLLCLSCSTFARQVHQDTADAAHGLKLVALLAATAFGMMEAGKYLAQSFSGVVHADLPAGLQEDLLHHSACDLRIHLEPVAYHYHRCQGSGQ